MLILVYFFTVKIMAYTLICEKDHVVKMRAQFIHISTEKATES